MRTIVTLGVVALALAGCATAPKKLADCKTNIGQENEALDAVIAKRFGPQRYGYNTLVEQPRRVRDARGYIVLKAYRIYPITLPEPEVQPEGRRLNVWIDPCTLKAVKVADPA